MKLSNHAFLMVIIFIGCSSSQVSKVADVQDRVYKDRLIEVAKRFYSKGLTAGRGGDISVRVSGTDRFIIKATRNSLGDLNYDRLSTVNFNGEVREGDPQPSHEVEIHGLVYQLHDHVGAIMHMHSPYATSWATVGRTIPPLTQQSVKILKGVSIVPYYPVGSEELVEAVAGHFENPETQVVMMENHGTFVVGSDLYDLLYKAEVVENTARIAYFSEALGTPRSFTFQDYR